MYHYTIVSSTFNWYNFRGVGQNRIVIIVGILLFIGLIVYATRPFIINGFHGPERITTTITNLESLRSAISMYYAKTGEYPGNDLRELVTVQFNVGDRKGPYLPEIPPETISLPRGQAIAPNSPSRKVHNKLNSEGGWFYDTITNRISVNYDKVLDNKWEQHAGENPSRW